MKFNWIRKTSGEAATLIRIDHRLSITEIATLLVLDGVESDDPLTKVDIERRVRSFLKYRGADELWGYNPDEYWYVDVEEEAEVLALRIADLFDVSHPPAKLGT